MALYFQNSVWGTTVWVAFAYYDPNCGAANQNFRKQGWWQLDYLLSGLGFNAWNVDTRTINRFAYFYAAASDGTDWNGTGNGWLSVRDPIFDQCALDDTGNNQWVDFNEIDFARAEPGWDFIVQLWRWEGQNRIQFWEYKEKGPDGDPIFVTI